MPDYAKPFEDMATEIRKNEAIFAGAVIVVLPDDSEPIWFLNLAQRPDLLRLLADAKTSIEIRERELMQAAQAQDPWGQRR